MAAHWYNSKGVLVAPGTPKAFPSATTILAVQDKPNLNAWKLKVGLKAANKKQQDSSARGTAIHQLVSDWITGKPVEAEQPEHEEMLHGYINWAEKNHPTSVESEIFLRSKKHGFAGTADIICRLNGELWVLDLKTSRALNPSYGLQLRAYEQALFETRGEHARTAVIQLTQDNKNKYRFKEYDEPLEVLLAMKTVFDWDFKCNPPQNIFDGRYLFA